MKWGTEIQSTHRTNWIKLGFTGAKCNSTDWAEIDLGTEYEFQLNISQ